MKTSKDNLCLMANTSDPWIWHKRFDHTNFKHISRISKLDSIRGLPKMKFKVNNLCYASQFGKLKKSSFKSKDEITTSKPLELINMYLFGTSQTQSINQNKYVFVIVDVFLDLLGLCSLKIKVMLSISLKLFLKGFKIYYH